MNKSKKNSLEYNKIIFSNIFDYKHSNTHPTLNRLTDILFILKTTLKTYSYQKNRYSSFADSKNILPVFKMENSIN